MSTADKDANEDGRSVGDVLRDFVREAVARLLQTDEQPQGPGFDFCFERGEDDNFHERSKPSWYLSRMLLDDFLQSIPGYQACLGRLESDAVIGRHLNRFVGIGTSFHRLEPRSIFLSLFYEMFDDEGQLVFSDDKFS